jgi:hypothetical protein
MKLTPHHEVLQFNLPPMSSTLLRLGLWVVLAVVALYVLHETYAETHLAEYFSTPMLQKVLVVGGLLVVAGLIMRVVERGAKRVVHKNRCTICKVPVPDGAIYCREHLRRVLQREDERTHLTHTRR